MPEQNTQLFRLRARDDTAGPLKTAADNFRKFGTAIVNVVTAMRTMNTVASGLANVLGTVVRSAVSRLGLSVGFLVSVWRESVQTAKELGQEALDLADSLDVTVASATQLRYISAITGESVEALAAQMREQNISVTELAEKYGFTSGEAVKFGQNIEALAEIQETHNRRTAETVVNMERARAEFAQALAPLQGFTDRLKLGGSRILAYVSELEFLTFGTDEAGAAAERASEKYELYDEKVTRAQLVSNLLATELDKLESGANLSAEEVRRLAIGLELSEEQTRALIEQTRLLIAELNRLANTNPSGRVQDALNRTLYQRTILGTADDPQAIERQRLIDQNTFLNSLPDSARSGAREPDLAAAFRRAFPGLTDVGVQSLATGDHRFVIEAARELRKALEGVEFKVFLPDGSFVGRLLTDTDQTTALAPNDPRRGTERFS